METARAGPSGCACLQFDFLQQQHLRKACRITFSTLPQASTSWSANVTAITTHDIVARTGSTQPANTFADSNFYPQVCISSPHDLRKSQDYVTWLMIQTHRSRSPCRKRWEEWMHLPMRMICRLMKVHLAEGVADSEDLPVRISTHAQTAVEAPHLPTLERVIQCRPAGCLLRERPRLRQGRPEFQQLCLAVLPRTEPMQKIPSFMPRICSDLAR